MHVVNSIRILRNNHRYKSILSLSKLYSTKSSKNLESEEEKSNSGDVLIGALSKNTDITVKVINCRELVQEAILRNNLNQVSGKLLGETLVCGCMMGAGLKDQESLQLNLVGNRGIRNVMMMTDGELQVRGMVGDSNFMPTQGSLDSISMKDVLGEGQVQVVKNHPTWKTPGNGIITFNNDLSIAMNLALYLKESEQRSGAMLTEVRVDGNLCRHALGIMVEKLPGADDDVVERSIFNLEKIQDKGLRSYLDIAVEELDNSNSNSGHLFRNFEPVLNKIVDDSLEGIGCEVTYQKYPEYTCSCSLERVWRALRLMDKKEITEIVQEAKPVEMTCEFCGEIYSLACDEIEKEILNTE